MRDSPQLYNQEYVRQSVYKDPCRLDQRHRKIILVLQFIMSSPQGMLNAERYIIIFCNIPAVCKEIWQAVRAYHRSMVLKNLLLSGHIQCYC